MKVNWKKGLIGTVASATLISGAGAAAFAANGADDAAKQGARISRIDDRREPEARERIAEGEREVGDDHGREAEERGREREAEHENEAGEMEREAGEDRDGDRSGPSANSGPGSAHSGNDDGPGHDRGDDHADR